MPEGPSIVILREETIQFVGKKVLAVEGNAKIDLERIHGQIITAITNWGKQYLICFKEFTIRIHLLMWGSYRINERKDLKPRLSLTMKNGELNFYSCSVKLLEGDVNQYYEWSADVMNDHWSPQKAKQKLEAKPDRMICDALLEQEIFSGVGNIIKNEVLYRTRVHPETRVGDIPTSKLDEIIREARNYSFEFMEWKKNYELKKHWLVYNHKICKRCDLPITRKHTGVKNRRSFFCTNCQQFYHE